MTDSKRASDVVGHHDDASSLDGRQAGQFVMLESSALSLSIPASRTRTVHAVRREVGSPQCEVHLSGTSEIIKVLSLAFPLSGRRPVGNSRGERCHEVACSVRNGSPLGQTFTLETWQSGGTNKVANIRNSIAVGCRTYKSICPSTDLQRILPMWSITVSPEGYRAHSLEASRSPSHRTQVESLKAQEDACVLPAFNSDVAWELGTIIRTLCQQKYDRPAAVYIAHANSSQLFFFATSRPGTLPDNMHWVKRKEAVVLRWGMSSFRMRLQMQNHQPEMHVQEALKDKFEMADPSVYGCHGGGFPVRVRGVEGVVGVIVVSGLKQEDDHSVIVDGIQKYLGRNN